MRVLWWLLVSAMALPLPAGSQPSYDEDTGLVIAPGWEQVKAKCTRCHSPKLIIGQRGSRTTWTEIIRWMQDTQGLEQFTAEEEQSLLDYLAANYAPGATARRKPLDAALLPPNPYSSAYPSEGQHHPASAGTP